MNRHSTSFLFAILLLLSLSCSLLTDSPLSDDDSSVDVPRYDGPTPEPGTGNVYGNVRWNSLAAADIHVELCEEYSFFSGCDGASFQAVSNSEGGYLFTAIPPGEYNLAIRLFNTDDWIYVTDGFISAAAFTVTADETTVIPTQNIYKLDVKPTHPTGNTVEPGPLTLSWRPYESASYYEITLLPDQGETIFAGQRVDTNEMTAELPPYDCEYRWQIEAFNRDGIKIAATSDYLTFAVTGQTASCLLTLLNPPDNVELDSGSGVVLEWTEHPAAATYDILMWNDSLPDRPHILDFVTTTVPSYHFGQTLEPGRYVWSVRAFNDDDKQVAGSDIFDFTVK